MECCVYDHARSPRGRGRPDGALHGVAPIDLAAHVLGAIRDRNASDTALVDDVVLGCVKPVGEQGADIARLAVLHADYAQTVAGVQINRFRASGLEPVNMAAVQVMSGQFMSGSWRSIPSGSISTVARSPWGTRLERPGR